MKQIKIKKEYLDKHKNVSFGVDDVVIFRELINSKITYFVYKVICIDKDDKFHLELIEEKTQ